MESPERLFDLLTIPARFTVSRVARLNDDGTLRVEPVAPYEKDYDTDPDEGPASWSEYFDLSTWRCLAVREGGRLVAGAALAVFEPPFTLFDGHAERCVLWDLRVAPHARRRGWARALLGEAINEARRQGATRLVVETQDVNVPALGLYQSAGGILRSWLPEAYETLDEVCCIFEFAW